MSFLKTKEYNIYFIIIIITIIILNNNNDHVKPKIKS